MFFILLKASPPVIKFPQIFAQFVDQGLGQGKNHMYNVQYYPAVGKNLKNLQKLTVPLSFFLFVEGEL